MKLCQNKLGNKKLSYNKFGYNKLSYNKFGYNKLSFIKFPIIADTFFPTLSLSCMFNFINQPGNYESCNDEQICLVPTYLL